MVNGKNTTKLCIWTSCKCNSYDLRGLKDNLVYFSKLYSSEMQKSSYNLICYDSFS